MKKEMPIIKYTCPKCGNRKYKMSEIIVAFNVISKIFDITGTRYSAVICDRCKYTEFYNVPLKKIKEALDFIPGT